jgi:hypothetical protein
MADSELKIILSLVDEASAKLKKAMGGLKDETDGVAESNKKLGEQSDKAHKTIGDGLKESTKKFKEFRREMFVITLAFAAIVGAVKTAAEYSTDAANAYDKFTASVKSLGVMLGQFLHPALTLISTVVNGLKIAISAVIAGFIKAFAFVGEFFSNLALGPLEAYKRAIEVANRATDEFLKKSSEIDTLVLAIEAAKAKMKEFADALEKVNLAYMTGQMTAQRYYEILTSGDVVAFQSAQARMQLMQQMAALENLMNNQSLMDYQTNVQAKMSLLNTLKSYHQTMWSTMFDFVNMGIQKFSAGMTTALTSIIMGTKKAGEAFKEFGISMITSIVEFVIQYGIQMMIAAAFSNLIAGLTIGQAGVIAAAWMPAAILASIATLGGAAGVGTAAVAGAMASGAGLLAATKVIGSATGGWGGIGVGGGGGGGGGGGCSTPTVASPGGGGVGGGGWAEGGSGIVSRPTLFLAGEAGPERFAFTPVGKDGGSGNSISIVIENASFRNENDIEDIMVRLSDLITVKTRSKI